MSNPRPETGPVAQRDVLIFGYSPIAEQVCSLLSRAGRDFALADFDEIRLENARQQGIAASRRDHTLDEELRASGIGTSVDILFALFPEESDNVFLIISARALDPELQIITVCHSGNSATNLLQAGATSVLDPCQLAARQIADLVHRPEVVQVLDNIFFGDADLLTMEITISGDSPILGIPVSELELPLADQAIPIGIVRPYQGPALHLLPDIREHVLTAGDVLLVTGREAVLRALRKTLSLGESGKPAQAGPASGNPGR